MDSHTTVIFILGTIAYVFACDTAFEIWGKHATVSEVTTEQIHSSKWKMAVFFLLVGILLGHFLFSTY